MPYIHVQVSGIQPTYEELKRPESDRLMRHQLVSSLPMRN